MHGARESNAGSRRRACLAALAGAAAAMTAAGQSLQPTADVNDPMVEFNGVWYRVSGAVADGRQERLFSDGTRTFTLDELRAHVAAQRPKVITEALRARLAAVAPGAPVEVVVVLRNQPAGPASRAVFAPIQPRIDDLSERIRAVTRRVLGAGGGIAALSPRDAATKRAAQSELDDLVRAARLEVARRCEAAVAPDQAALALAVRGFGGEVTGAVSFTNAVFVRIPAAAAAALAAHPLVATLDANHAGAPELNNHRHSLGLETGFWASGIDGGVHDVGVLDTGVQANHPALNTHRIISSNGGVDSDGHGTGMAGILASTDATNRGMAFGCDAIVAAIAGAINTSMTGMQFIVNTGEPENVNYSFGNGTANTSDYTTTDQFFDGAISTHRFMVSKSTGNGGFGSGNPTITHPAPAFNLMASANIYDQDTVSRTDDRIDSSSSRGPTFGGRKKPDIAAPGTNSMSTTRALGFGNIGGTSSASPHTGGGVVLLYDAGATDVKIGKAILLNTTDAMDDRGTSTQGDDIFVQGSLWNRRYGWGYLNLGRAHQRSTDYFTASIPASPENADFRLYAGTMAPFDRATLVWERHVAYNGSTFPTQIETLSDLDLTAWSEAGGARTGGSESRIDNVEQFHATVGERTVLKVEAFGTFDPQVPTESFALATPAAFTAMTGPAFDPAFDHPASVSPEAEFDVAVEVENSGDLAAHAVSVTFAGATVVNGANPAPLGTIAAGGSAQAVWRVRAPLAPGAVNVSVAISSNSYGEAFAGQGQSQFNVGSCYPDCDTSTGVGNLDIFDFLCFQNRYDAGDPYACECDTSTGPGVCDIFDFLCFQNAFDDGCP